MYKIKCFYDQFSSGELFNYCQFLDNSSNQKINTRGTVYQYIIYVLTGDLYLQKDIDENLEFIHQAENNPNEVY
ncbi:putative identified by MetaGeneAnnotator, partial [Neisseria meningitidis NM95]